MSFINILIADDQSLVRKGIRALLEKTKDLKVVGEAATGEEAVALATKCKPDIVTMDIRMPGIGGLEATRRLLRKNKGLKVLVLTGADHELYPKNFVEVGVSGYMNKHSEPDELTKALRAIHSGKLYFGDGITEQLLASNKKKSPFDALSPRELQVMHMITKGVKAQIIAKKLNLSSKTVNSYRYRMFEKLSIVGKEGHADVLMTLKAVRSNVIDIDLL